jgi:hypothetical protein
MKKLLSVLAALAVGATTFAAAIDDYVKARKAVKVVGTSSPQVLDALVGAKDVEIEGIVKGVVSVESGASILLERTDKQTLYVKADKVPDWLNGNEIRVRMLLKVARNGEYADLTARMVAVIPHADMVAWEAKFAKKPDPKANTNSKTVASQSKSTLTGTITSKGTRLNGSTTSRSGSTKNSTNKKGDWVVSPKDAIPLYAQFAKKHNKKLTDAEATRIAEGVIAFSIHYEVDARLIMAMILAESTFDPRVTSHAGAQGLVQLMPGTARELGVKNAMDPIDNLSGAVKLVSKHIDTYKAKTGDDFEALVLMLAAYNAGPGAVKKHGGVPPYRETQNYVKKVISYYRQICGYE